MKFTKLKVLAAAVALLAASACGSAGSDDDGADVKVDDKAASKFEDGTYMKQLADKGTINVGVKYDQPGLGFKGAADNAPKGFDIEMAKILIASLGIDPNSDKVTWTETVSDNREPFLQAGKVDLVLASYSITPERREVVGQAGPYLVTGQQVLVKEDSDIEGIDDLEGKEVCSVTGSTSLKNVQEKGMKPVGFDTYSECVEKVLDGTVEAMSTDGSILLGYAADHEGELKVVGDEFSEENIGVGYSQDHPEMCEWITDTLQEAMDDGNWEKSFDATLGKSGSDAPDAPEMEPCAS